MNRRASCLFAALTLTSAPALAKGAYGDRVFVGADLTQVEDVSQADTTKSRRIATIYDLRLGYTLDFGLMLGVEYWNYGTKAATSSNEGTTISGWGPLVGFLHESGVNASLTYLVQPEKNYNDDNDTLDTHLYGGNGTLLSVGYLAPIGNSFAVGLNIIQSTVTYEKGKLGRNPEASLTGKWYDSSTYPYLSLMVFF